MRRSTLEALLDDDFSRALKGVHRFDRVEKAGNATRTRIEEVFSKQAKVSARLREGAGVRVRCS